MDNDSLQYLFMVGLAVYGLILGVLVGDMSAHANRMTREFEAMCKMYYQLLTEVQKEKGGDT